VYLRAKLLVLLKYSSDVVKFGALKRASPNTTSIPIFIYAEGLIGPAICWSVHDFEATFGTFPVSVFGPFIVTTYVAVVIGIIKYLKFTILPIAYSFLATKLSIPIDMTMTAFRPSLLRYSVCQGNEEKAEGCKKRDSQCSRHCFG